MHVTDGFSQREAMSSVRRSQRRRTLGNLPQWCRGPCSRLREQGHIAGRRGYRAPLVTAALLLLAPQALSVGQDVGAQLRNAERFIRDGRYRSAERELTGVLARPALSPQGAAQAHILFVELFLNSGRFPAANESAQKYLNTFRRLARTRDADQTAVRQQELLWQAAITIGIDRKTLSMRNQLTTDERAALARGRQALVQTLGIGGGMRLTDPLWEAGVHLWLAELERALRIPSAADHFRLASDQSGRFLTTVLHHNRGAEEAVGAATIFAEASRRSGTAAPAVSLLRRLAASSELSREARARILVAAADCVDDTQAPQPGDSAREAAERSLREALELLESAPAPERAPTRVAEIYLRLAEFATERQDEPEARRLCQTAKALLDQVNDSGKQLLDADQQEEAAARGTIALQQLQELHLRLADWKEGIKVSQELLARRRQLLLDDDPDIARAQTALGSFQAREEEYGNAREPLEAALAFWRNYEPTAHIELAVTRTNLAGVYVALGEYQAAGDLLAAAIPALETLLPADDLRLAEALNNRAMIETARGRYTTALASYERAREICHAGPRGASPRRLLLEADVLLNLAQLYKSQNQLDRAAQECEAALKARDAAGKVDGRQRWRFQLALSALYIAQATDGDAEQKRTCLEKAEASVDAVLRELNDHPDTRPETRAAAQHLRAVVYYHLSDSEQAERGWITARELAQKNRLHALELRAIVYLLRLYSQNVRQGSQGSAALTASHSEAPSDPLQRLPELAERAYELQKSVQAYPGLQFLALLYRAEVLRRFGDRQGANETLKEAIGLVQVPRAHTTGSDLERAEYYARYVRAFDLLAQWLTADGDLETALCVSESKRSRTYLDQVRASGMDRFATHDPAMRALVAQRESILERYHSTLFAVRAYDETTAQNDHLWEQLGALHAEFARIENQLHATSPIYQHVLGSPPAETEISAARGRQLATTLTRRAGSALVYHIGSSCSFLLVIRNATPPTITHVPITVSKEQVSLIGIPDRFVYRDGRLTSELARYLVNRLLSHLVSDKAFSVGRGVQLSAANKDEWACNVWQSQAIADIFLPSGARSRIMEAAPEVLVVVPDGALHQLPLEALLVDAANERYLVDLADFPAICYAPSAEILAALADRPPRTGSLAVLSVGDPDYARPAKNLTDTTDPLREKVDVALDQKPLDFGYDGFVDVVAGDGLEPLPFTKTECLHLTAEFAAIGGEPPVLLLGPDASEERVRQAVGGKHVVHFAAHGLVDQRYDNLFGAILLSPPFTAPGSSNQDGFLSLYEIATLELSACELAILSACQTNCGPERPLEAGSTLARAFIAAGAGRVVCSQWNVPDDATAKLVEYFAAELVGRLQEGQISSTAQSLLAARRRVKVENPNWSAPRYWAPLILVGPP